jgi:hypothetical protein
MKSTQMKNIRFVEKGSCIMKTYEITRQGSRFVVKTHDGSNDHTVSTPFRTHAAALEFVDKQRHSSEDSLHGRQNESGAVLTNEESYEAVGNKYGFTVCEGRQYALTEVPHFSGTYGLGISADNYSAKCIDTNSKEYTAFFEIIEKDANNDVLADWDNASLVERVP